MKNNEGKWRHVDRGDLVMPLPDNPLNGLLAKYGIFPPQIAGRLCNAADFIKDERFKDYGINIYGVSQDEELPHPQLFWQDEGGAGYYCWQIQIYWQNSGARIEATWFEDADHYEVVTLWGALSQLEKSLVTAMDEGMNLLLFIIDRMTKSTHGGRRNVKMPDLSDEIKWALGTRYVELKEQLRNVRQAAKLSGKSWRDIVLQEYPILEEHQDLLNHIDPLGVPEDINASDPIKDPWQIAIEIAARETIPEYKNNGVSANTLKSAAILPDSDMA